MIVARVLTGVCEEVDLAASVLPFFNENGYAVDTFRNGAKTELLKVNPNEAYPNFVLVYRDLEGDADFRSSRLTEDVIKHAQISYRAGTRFNPEEIEFKGLENRQREQVKAKESRFPVIYTPVSFPGSQEKEEQIQILFLVFGDNDPAEAGIE